MARLATRGICAICSGRHFAVASSSATVIAARPITRALSSAPPRLRQTPTKEDRLAAAAERPGRSTHSQDRRQTRMDVAPPRLSPADFRGREPPSAMVVVKMLLGRMEEWSESERTADKLAAYGLSAKQVHDGMRAWRAHLDDSLRLCSSNADAEAALAAGGWDMSRLRDALQSGDDWPVVFESSLLRHLLARTASHPPASIPTAVTNHLSSILATTDLTRVPFGSTYTQARTMSRHFHLHVGPTNSGKTYSALKALSKAKTGAYAGPLRLLAHEVWERLNLGTVGGLDGVGRACNLITGEERRIVDETAGLISCTVEMLPVAPVGLLEEVFDVVVIDEIQMMGDTQRGGAWTAAVLGVKAKEVHLCGDETTVQLLSSLLPTLGDKVTVHRYERLTPLKVAEESLGSDWNKVQPGDCVVTFSRTNIFAVKKLVESTAGRKCAVVYGALPPETRAEQAREFNEGRAEVLVASDAVGMGLNLKIKRMIFESLHKFNGKNEVPLPLTSVKQIAGRAGRYGMHKAVPAVGGEVAPAISATTDSVEDGVEAVTAAAAAAAEVGGEVTTLHNADLPILRDLLPLPLPSLSRAIIDVSHEVLARLQALLPPGTTHSELLEHAQNLALPPPHTTLADFAHKLPLANVAEDHHDVLTMSEMEMLCFAPVNVRDPLQLGIFRNMVNAYATKGNVGVDDCIGSTRLIRTMEQCEATIATLPPMPPVLGIGRRPLVPPIIISSLPQLESLHKSLVSYIWLGFRIRVAFPDRELAQELKERTEKVLDECLMRLPGLRQKKTAERSAEMDRAVAAWRRENVAPDGKLWGHSGKIKAQKKFVQKMEKQRTHQEYVDWVAQQEQRGAEGGERKKVEWKDQTEGRRSKRAQTWKGFGVVDMDAAAGREAGRPRPEL